MTNQEHFTDDRESPSDGAVARVDDALSATAEYWSTRDSALRFGRDHWEAHPACQEALDRRRGGQPLIEWLARQLPTGPERGAGLGAGSAQGELDLMRRCDVERFDLFDVTSVSLQKASEAASSLGLGDRVQCHVTDVNDLVLEADSYDVITCLSSLHHVENLDRVLAQCRTGLRDGGVLVAHEYVGPDRFAFPTSHVDLAGAIYRTLLPQLRCPWPELPVPVPADVAKADPTEAVRSSEILDAARRYFPGLQVISYNVALTVILWYGLNHDALYDTPEGRDLVGWLLEVDQALVTSGRLTSYYALLLARKT